MAGHGRPADRAPVRQRHAAGLGLRASASATGGPTGTPAAWTSTARAGRSCTSTSSRPRSAGSSPPTTGSSPTPGRRWSCSSRWRAERQAAGRLADRAAWVQECRQRQRDHAAAHPLRQRADQAAAGVRGDEPGVRPGDPATSSTIGLSQIAAAQFLHVYRPRHWINAGQAGPLGWTTPAALGVCVADPDTPVVALSGDYDFQFMIEELAVGRAVQPALHPRAGEQRLPGPDQAVAARLRHGLLRAAVLRQRQRARARRLRRRPRQGGRGPRLQGAAGDRAGRASGPRSRRPRS